jgi:hypothetical protein
MTPSPAVVTARAAPSLVDSLRVTFPVRAVILPWLVARILTVPMLVLGTPGDHFYPGSLIAMDGLWFRLIALDGYDVPYVAGSGSEYPFFPLFPGVAGLLMRLRIPDTVALAGVSWAAALLALAGAHRLATRHLDARVSPWATWVLALAPGSLSLVLGYADALFLAGLVWSLVFADEHRWLAAGIVAGVATASRPNGVVVIVALLVTVVVARGGWRAAALVTVPSVTFLVGWLWYLEVHVGDALVFWKAKDAWPEVSLGNLLADPFGRALPMTHFAVFALAAALYAGRVRSQPVAWGVVSLLILIPPFAVGVVGLARYTALAFPLQLAVTDVLARRGRTWITGYLVLSGLGLAGFALLVVSRSWVP